MAPSHHVRRVTESSEDAVDVQLGIRADSDIFELVDRRLASTDDLAPGVRISENIRLVSLLRAGGMANVWIAEHAGLEMQVAVKFMSGELANDAGCAARFGTEAKLAARIKSPHVVDIFDYATTPAGLPYIVMELLEGEDLEMRIRRNGPLGLEDSSRVVVQICRALTKAHALGIVHRDIKPDNVFLVEHEGELFVKVLDFGIAKDATKLQSLTAAGAMMGTPSFMSPEQIFRPKEVDHRSDLWSTAVVAYGCLTGRLPFEGDNFGTMCLSIHDGKFAAPSSIDRTVPREIDAWFEKALSLAPAARFQSASDMSNAYLAELDKAQLLPNWVIARESEGHRTSYTSASSSILRGTMGLRHGRRPDARTLVISLLVAALAVLATSPERGALYSVVRGWVGAPAGNMAPFSLPLEDPPLVSSASWARVPAPPSPPAVAKRGVARVPRPVPAARRKAVSDNPYDLPATPATSAERGATPTPRVPSDQFGI
jgi:serine/threonine protein kinase